MIAKLQRPLYPPTADYLFYVKGGRHTMLIAASCLPRWVREAAEGEFKAYFHVEVRGEMVKFLDVAEHQDW